MFKAAKNQCLASQYIEGNKTLTKRLLGDKVGADGTEYFCFDDASVLERRPGSYDEAYEEGEVMPWKSRYHHR